MIIVWTQIDHETIFSVLKNSCHICDFFNALLLLDLQGSLRNFSQPKYQVESLFDQKVEYYILGSSIGKH